MPSNQDHQDVGLLHATNLYSRSQLFELNKVYILKKMYNNELGQTIWALMDGETYSGSLTEKGADTVARLFQPGHTVKVRVTKVGETSKETYSPRLKRFQAWTHGRGDAWQEADEASTAPDGQAAPTSVPADDNSSSGQSSTD